MIIPKFQFPIYVTIIVLSIIIGLIYIFVSIKKEKEWKPLVGLYFILSFYMILAFGILLSYLINPTKLDIFHPGLTSYGGAIGLLGSALIFERIINLNGKLIKYSILSLPLIYSVSKIGCLLAGCCYGIPYNGIGSIIYSSGLNIPVFPIQLLETIVFMIIFIIINKYKNSKNILLLSIIVMSVFKFLLDFLRYEHYEKVFTMNQMFSLLILIGTSFLLLYKHKKNNVKSS